ncbi:MAG: FlgD immunoglobulin-like domain containing protein [Candidatus Kapaibacterium sp.]
MIIITRYRIAIAIVLIAMALAPRMVLAQGSRPSAQITGYDWSEQWIVPARANGTRNTSDGYDALIWVYNGGRTSYDIASFALVGKDADDGYFTLDSSDRLTTIHVGDRVMGSVDTAGIIQNRLSQRVRFRPTEERAYSCTVVMTIAGYNGTIASLLIGGGTETHAVVTGRTFGPADFVASGAEVDSAKSITISAGAMRDLTLLDVIIAGPDSADFSIAPGALAAAGIPGVIPAGQGRTISVEFRPRSAGRKVAYVQPVGNQSSWDPVPDSLIGYTFDPSLGADGDAAASHAGYLLESIMPNPIVASADISYRLGASGSVNVTIHSAAGERVALLADGPQSAGEHRLTWDASSLPSGLYYCHITSGRWSVSRPMLVTR